MRKKLLYLIPELQLFKDSLLKDKTIQVWEQALKEGGWTIEDLLEMPFTLLIPDTTVNIIKHTRAVTCCAMKIADVLLEEYKEKVSINKDFLLAGSILHDVGKLFEYERKNGQFQKSKAGKLLRHPISGAAFANKFEIPQEILHIIAAHSKEGDGQRRTVEAIIVNHADFVNFDVLKT